MVAKLSTGRGQPGENKQGGRLRQAGIVNHIDSSKTFSTLIYCASFVIRAIKLRACFKIMRATISLVCDQGGRRLLVFQPEKKLLLFALGLL